jgi:hypothetical protein
LKTLLEEYLSFCKIREEYRKNGSLTIRENFLNPTQILPIYDLVKMNNIDHYDINVINPNVSSYFFNILNRKIHQRSTFSYIPVTELPINSNEVYEILDEVFELFQNLSGYQVIEYLIHELVDNIYEHSEFSSALVIGQKDSSNELVKLGFFDNGITIPENIRRNTNISKGPDDCIYEAINGLSTKKIEGRGKGLPSSIKLCTKMHKGEFLVVSGKGIIHINENNQLRKFSPNESRFFLDGTLISLRYPIKENIADFYEYVE